MIINRILSSIFFRAASTWGLNLILLHAAALLLVGLVCFSLARSGNQFKRQRAAFVLLEVFSTIADSVRTLSYPKGGKLIPLAPSRQFFHRGQTLSLNPWRASAFDFGRSACRRSNQGFSITQENRNLKFQPHGLNTVKAVPKWPP
jgi:hypothetical protein